MQKITIFPNIFKIYWRKLRKEEPHEESIKSNFIQLNIPFTVDFNADNRNVR